MQSLSCLQLDGAKCANGAKRTIILSKKHFSNASKYKNKHAVKDEKRNDSHQIQRQHDSDNQQLKTQSVDGYEGHKPTGECFDMASSFIQKVNGFIKNAV